MQQRTHEWYEKRKSCVTSSDIPVLMGLIKDKTALMLWEEKKGLREPDKQNEAMRHGIITEPKALAKLVEFTGIEFQPAVVFHPEIPSFMASLDGIDYSESRACEIKCPYNRLAFEADKKRGRPRDSHYVQMQWHMFCTDIQTMIYFVYWDDHDWIIQECVRNDVCIESCYEAARKFLECLISDTPPKDKYVRPSEGELDDLEAEILDAKRAMNEAKARFESAKLRALEYSEYQPITFGSIRIDAVETKGNVDYKSIPELQNVDLESYRKASYVKYVLRSDDL